MLEGLLELPRRWMDFSRQDVYCTSKFYVKHVAIDAQDSPDKCMETFLTHQRVIQLSIVHMREEQLTSCVCMSTVLCALATMTIMKAVVNLPPSSVQLNRQSRGSRSMTAMGIL